MIDLSNPKISYIVLSSEKINDAMSILYAKNYHIIPIKGFYKGQYEDSLIAFNENNDEMRKDLIFILNQFKEDSGIIKYFEETEAKRVFPDGSETPLGIVLYNTDGDNISYIHEGVSFSFVEQTRYWKPTKKEDFKIGMLVEYFNNNKWYEKKVENPLVEYNKLYKLMIKYDKIRVVSK